MTDDEITETLRFGVELGILDTKLVNGEQVWGLAEGGVQRFQWLKAALEEN
ncbi:hypothetical protein [Mycolicibacter arupensis]|jgi:hypothetical protein|uniref:hypothetical protein n=1 Tax=Mycolicibacter arupensis TaxID=342002 RepID=UPI0023F0A916|nr:hypothetical protein [Mycolicibacter arupensis]